MGDVRNAVVQLSEERRELLLLRLLRWEESGARGDARADIGEPDAGMSASGQEPSSETATPSSLITLQPRGAGRPLFCIHPVGGGVSCFYYLSRLLDEDRPLYGLQAKGLDDAQAPCDRIEQMAADYLRQMRSVQPRGPYALLGYSFGGHVAFEIAHQLRSQAEGVSLLALIDSRILPADMRREGDVDDLSAMVYFLTDTLHLSPEQLKEVKPEAGLEQVWRRLQARRLLPPGVRAKEFRRSADVFTAHLNALRHYKHRPYAGRIILFRVEKNLEGLTESLGWSELADKVEVHIVPGTHYNVLNEPNVNALFEKIKEYL